MKTAADGLADAADKYVIGICSQSENVISRDINTPSEILDTIIEARQKLYENNVSNTSDIVIEVSPKIASLILKAKINLATDNVEALENGCIGYIGGCKVYVSNNISSDLSGSCNYYKCIMRTKRAVAYAEQLSEIDAYRPEKRFADAVKGLHLYGAQIVYPEELIVMELGVAANS